MCVNYVPIRTKAYHKICLSTCHYAHTYTNITVYFWHVFCIFLACIMVCCGTYRKIGMYLVHTSSFSRKPVGQANTYFVSNWHVNGTYISYTYHLRAIYVHTYTYMHIHVRTTFIRVKMSALPNNLIQNICCPCRIMLSSSHPRKLDPSLALPLSTGRHDQLDPRHLDSIIDRLEPIEHLLGEVQLFPGVKILMIGHKNFHGRQTIHCTPFPASQGW